MAAVVALAATVLVFSSHARAATCDLHVDVTNPAGGDYVKDTVTITWDVTGDDAGSATSDVDILDADGLVTDLISGLSGESTSWDTTSETDGSDYKIKVTASALCGSASDTTNTFTVDNTQPSSYSIDSPSSGDVVGGDVDVAFSGTETNKDVVDLEVSTDGGSSWSTIDGSATDDGTYTWDSTTVSDGSDVQLRLTPTDLAGNTGSSVTTNSFEVDNTAPSSYSIDAPTGGDVVGDGDVSITWSGTELNKDVVDLEVSTDGGSSWSTIDASAGDDGSYTWDSTTVDDGSDVQLRLAATDLAGNAGPTVTTDSFTVDNTVPASYSIDSPSSGDVVGDGDISVAWTGTEANEDVVDLEVSTDGGSSWSTVDSSASDDGSYTWDSTTVDDGSDVQLRLTPTDLVGQVGSAVSTASFVVDNTAPASYSIDSPSSGDVVGGDHEITFSGTDANKDVVKLEVSSDGGSTWSTIRSSTSDDGAYTWDTSSHDDGSDYKLRLTPTDLVGQVGPAVTTSSFIVDNTAPSLSLDAPEDGADVGDGVTVEWTASDANGLTTKLQLSDDGGETWEDLETGLAADGSTTWTPEDRDDGAYELRIRTVDAAGLVETEEVDVEINVNLPTVDMEAPDEGATLDEVPDALEGTASDANVSVDLVEVQVSAPNGSHWDADAGTWSDEPVWNEASGAENWSLALDADAFDVDGVYQLDLRVTDALGQDRVDSTYFEMDRPDVPDADADDPTSVVDETLDDATDRMVDVLPEEEALSCEPGEDHRFDDADGDGVSDDVPETCKWLQDWPHPVLQEVYDTWEIPEDVLDNVRCNPAPCERISDLTESPEPSMDHLARTACQPPGLDVEACRRASRALNDPGLMCEAYHKDMYTRGHKWDTGTRDACALTAGVLANICNVGTGAQALTGASTSADDTVAEAESECERHIQPVADVFAEYADADCTGPGDWIETEIEGTPGADNHSATTEAPSAAAGIDRIHLDWTSYHNQLNLCIQPTDGLKTDVPSPALAFPSADLCDESAFEAEVRSRYTGDAKEFDVARLTFRVPDHCTKGAGAPTLFHYDPNEDDPMPGMWEALEARPVENLEDSTVYEAETTSMSPFVFGYRSSPAGGNAAPDAAFDVTCEGRTCTFDGLASRDADGTVDAYAWELGDGTEAQGAQAQHTYEAAGTYQVTLTVWDDDQAHAATQKTVRVVAGNQGPEAGFAWSCEDGTCTFDATDSSDADGAIVAYDWRFGDGHQASGETVSHTFHADREYQVTLTVRDEAGASGSTTQTVAVTGTGRQPGDDGGGDDGTGDAVAADEDVPDWLSDPGAFLEWLVAQGLYGLLFVVLTLAAVPACWACLRKWRADREEPAAGT